MSLEHLSRPSPGIFKKWFAACTMGEILGFGAVALFAWFAFLLFGIDHSSIGAKIGVLGLMIIAGIFEGSILGTLQWVVLQKVFPKLSSQSWIGVTILVAGLGWFFGMLPSTFMSEDSITNGGPEASMFVVLVAAMVMGALVGTVFGFAQWLVLRHHANNAHRWIYANTLGWALGLPWSYVAGSLANFNESVLLSIVIGMIAGLLMGGSVALITGFALIRLRVRVRPDPAPKSPEPLPRRKIP